MMNKRKNQKTKKLKKDILAALKEKLAELILLREDIKAQENVAKNLAEKKELVQQLIDLTHQIQAVRLVIDLFSNGE
jgi:predicted flavoprotein YhiN